VVPRLRDYRRSARSGIWARWTPWQQGCCPCCWASSRACAVFLLRGKELFGGIRFGFSTDTYDAEGDADGRILWPAIDPPMTLDQVRAAGQPLPRRDGADAARLLRKKKSPALRPTTGTQGKPVELKPAKVYYHRL